MIGLFLLLTPSNIEWEIKEEPATQPSQLDKVILAPKTKLEIIEFLKLTAEKNEIDSNKFLKVAICESGLNPNAVGDGGYSYGLWQIHSPSHPTVNKEMAFDVVKSTEWAAEKFKINPNIWTCYRKLYN